MSSEQGGGPIIRQRSRAPEAPPQQENRPTLLKTGPQIEAARAQEVQRQEARQRRTNQPWRLWVPWQGTDADRTKEFIILDSHVDQCPVFYEHALPDPANDGKRTLHEMCVKEVEHCPLCEKYGDSYYVQVMSVIELIPEGRRLRDNTMIYHQKKLLPVKFQQQAWFVQAAQSCGGNFRGLHVVTVRDNNQRSPAIGTPSFKIHENQVVRYTEDQLQQAFSHPEIRNQQGRVVKEANSDLYPYRYAQIFTTPTAAELRQIYGGVAPAGSSAEVEQTWGTAPAIQAPVPDGAVLGAAVQGGQEQPAPQEAGTVATLPTSVQQQPAGMTQPAQPAGGWVPAPAGAPLPGPGGLPQSSPLPQTGAQQPAPSTVPAAAPPVQTPTAAQSAAPAQTGSPVAAAGIQMPQARPGQPAQPQSSPLPDPDNDIPI